MGETRDGILTNHNSPARSVAFRLRVPHLFPCREAGMVNGERRTRPEKEKKGEAARARARARDSTGQDNILEFHRDQHFRFVA